MKKSTLQKAERCAQLFKELGDAKMVAKILNVTQPTVSTYLREMGIERRPKATSGLKPSELHARNYAANKESLKKKAIENYQGLHIEDEEERAEHQRAIIARRRKYYRENREYLLACAVKKFRENPGSKFGLLPEEYWEMVKEADGACQLCLGKLEKKCVDHDHKTGLVRGLICFHCNTALGHIRDSQDTLRRMIDYLESNSQFHSNILWLL